MVLAIGLFLAGYIAKAWGKVSVLEGALGLLVYVMAVVVVGLLLSFSRTFMTIGVPRKALPSMGRCSRSATGRRRAEAPRHLGTRRPSPLLLG